MKQKWAELLQLINSLNLGELNNNNPQLNKTYEQQILEKFDIYYDLYHYGNFYLKDKGSSTIIILKEDINSISIKFNVQIFKFSNENEQAKKEYLEVKAIIDNRIPDSKEHKLEKIEYDRLSGNYPYSICESIDNNHKDYQ